MAGSGSPVALGPFEGGMHNSASTGEFIDDKEVYDLVNLEVDTNKSLVNRPAVSALNTSGTSPALLDGVKVLGTYLPTNGRQFLVVSSLGIVRLLDLTTPGNSVGVSSSGSLFAASVIQYNNRLWVIPGPTDAGSGGYFESTTPTNPVPWTTVAAIPKGGDVSLYKERLWIVAGIGATVDPSRLRFSALGDGTSWPAPNFVDVDPGNGQKLVACIVLNNDMVLFKEHSTFRFGYEADPAKASLSKVNSNIGVPAANCAISYNNNNIYTMHDNSVYEMFNYTFTRISDNIDMNQKSDVSIYSTETYGLSLYRDRLFIRYYGNLYVYSLKTGTWSRWETTRKFSRITVIPTADIGLDIAYAASATAALPGSIFYFRDSRIKDVGVNEQFNCSLTSKTYEFTVPYAWKRMFDWGLTIATSGNTTTTAVVPNASKNVTWAQLALNTWGYHAINTPWGNETDINFITVVQPAKGAWARKFYKLNKSYRFVRTYFKVTTEAKPNPGTDASVRIYDITTFIKQGEKAVERVS